MKLGDWLGSRHFFKKYIIAHQWRLFDLFFIFSSGKRTGLSPGPSGKFELPKHFAWAFFYSEIKSHFTFSYILLISLGV
jgi:hypothetical protein